MFDKLEHIERKYEELEGLMGRQEIIADQNEFQKHAKAHRDLQEVVETYKEYKEIKNELEKTKSLLSEDGQDPEFIEMAESEIEELEESREKLEAKLKRLLLPKDPNDEKNVIVEIRAGTGGDEAGLFVGDLYRMYSRYAEPKNWKIELLDSHESNMGGFKEIVFMVKGKKAYSRLKYESGVHRVQRIPSTESQGRIHTSAATVAVLPEAEEVDVEIDHNELRVDIFCSSGPGGQSVNTTQSAVRITHEPTGIAASCQDEKSQHKNKEKAMRVLRARLYDIAIQEQNEAIKSSRRNQIGSGDRSERIRTYNFPQGRVTDHRIGLTLHKLEDVLEGSLDQIIEELITRDEADKLKEVEEKV